MAQLVIPDVEETLWSRLRDRAARHGRTPETEARLILARELQPARADPWAALDALRNELAATGKTFEDSVPLLREDRDR